MGPFYTQKRGSLSAECRKCICARQKSRYANDPEFRATVIARGKAWYQANPEYARNLIRDSRRRKYGISNEVFDQMFENQEGLCAICSRLMSKTAIKGEVFRVACVDHDHETGKVRGLLCNLCNSGIGKLKDSARLLRNAVQYLEGV